MPSSARLPTPTTPVTTGWSPALLLPLATVLIWSLNTIVTKSAAAVIEPASIALYRWVLAFIVLTPFVLRGVWRERAIIAANLHKLALLGGLGMAAYQGIAYQAAKTTTAINMGVIISVMPLMAVLLANWFSGEGLKMRRVAGALVSLAGVIVLIAHGDLQVLIANGLHIGDGLMLAAVFANALYGVLLKRWAIPLATWDQLYVQIFFGMLATLPFWFASTISPVTAQNAPLILFAGVFASLLAPMLWIAGIRRLGAAQASLFINLLPVIVALLAWGLLGEELHGFHVIGGTIALIGVAIAL